LAELSEYNYAEKSEPLLLSEPVSLESRAKPHDPRRKKPQRVVTFAA